MKGMSNGFDNTELAIVFNDPPGFILLGFVHPTGRERAHQSFEIVKVISSPQESKKSVHPGTVIPVLRDHIYSAREWIEEYLPKNFYDVLNDLAREQSLRLGAKVAQHSEHETSSLKNSLNAINDYINRIE